MKTLALTTLSLALLGCGSHGGLAGDAGRGGAGEGGPESASGRRSFDVVATVTMNAIAGANMMTLSNRLTIALEPDGRRAIAGGGGEARVVELARDADGTFHIATAINVGVSQASCAGLIRMSYETLAFSVTEGSLRGHATGHGFFASSDATPMSAPFEADLEGVPDTKPPSLILPPGQTIDDPLAPFVVWTSEPLPATALARMVSGEGAVIGLVPEVIDGEVPLIARFSKADFTMPPGQTFQALFSDDVIDLVGHVAPLGKAVPLTTFDAAPLVTADGFESATDATLGGAAVIRDGPGIPLSGAASLYIGQPGAPGSAGLALTPTLTVRMAAPRDATKVTFSYRRLFTRDDAGPAYVQVGSLGRVPGPAVPVPPAASSQTVSWAQETFSESPVATMEVPIPDERGDELVVVVRAPRPCNLGLGSPGLVIDDLKVE